jgi:hypothetical protein
MTGWLDKYSPQVQNCSVKFFVSIQIPDPSPTILVSLLKRQNAGQPLRLLIKESASLYQVFFYLPPERKSQTNIIFPFYRKNVEKRRPTAINLFGWKKKKNFGLTFDFFFFFETRVTVSPPV